MNTKRIYFILPFIVGVMFVKANNINIPEKVLMGFKRGDATLISFFFRESIELTINSKENIYSSTQAEIILKEFFKKNPPVSFKIIHEGGKTESKYAIGKLITSQGNFRITLLLKHNEGNPYIHQLRIEKDEI